MNEFATFRSHRRAQTCIDYIFLLLSAMAFLDPKMYENRQTKEFKECMEAYMEEEWDEGKCYVFGFVFCVLAMTNASDVGFYRSTTSIHLDFSTVHVRPSLKTLKTAEATTNAVSSTKPHAIKH